MSERVFSMRLACRYTGSENDLLDLEVELLDEGIWKTFTLNNDTAGFLIFVYSVFTCQHMHLRLGCEEHHLLLEAATGSIRLVTSEDWQLESVDINFHCRSRSGKATSEQVSDITRRMMNCPVSRNFQPGVDCKTDIRIDEA